MDIVEKIFSTFALIIGFGFIIYIYPILSGIIIPALNGAGMTGYIGWATFVFPVVFFGMIFLSLVIMFAMIWRGDEVTG